MWELSTAPTSVDPPELGPAPLATRLVVGQLPAGAACGSVTAPRAVSFAAHATIAAPIAIPLRIGG